MHQGDKLGLSAVGLLVRSKNKVIVNPFHAGVDLYKKVHKMGTHFSYAKRRSKLHDIAKSVNGPVIRLKLDLNKTRVASVSSLFYSELRMNKALKMYSATGNFEWTLSTEE